MQIAKIGKLGSSAIILVVFAIILFLNATKVSALSCLIPQNIFVAAYEQGIFVDGFVVEHRLTGNWCENRLMVSENTFNMQNVFSTASQNLNQRISSGVYQLSTWCWAERWDEGCTHETSLEQLSTNSKALARYKAEWQQREKDELRSVTTQKWSAAVIIIAFVALAVLWPWILVKIWPNLRRRLTLLLIIAIMLQAPLALILNWLFIWGHGIWQLAAFVGSAVLALSIIGEIILLIVRKIRSRNVSI